MYLYNRHIDDFKIGMEAKINNKVYFVTENTGERVYFGRLHRNWLNLKKVGLKF